MSYNCRGPKIGAELANFEFRGAKIGADLQLQKNKTGADLQLQMANLQFTLFWTILSLNVSYDSRNKITLGIMTFVFKKTEI